MGGKKQDIAYLKYINKVIQKHRNRGSMWYHMRPLLVKYTVVSFRKYFFKRSYVSGAVFIVIVSSIELLT